MQFFFYVIDILKLHVASLWIIFFECFYYFTLRIIVIVIIKGKVIWTTLGDKMNENSIYHNNSHNVISSLTCHRLNSTILKKT